MTKQQSRWGYIWSIIHLFFASATSLAVLGLTTDQEFTPLLGVVLAITIPASLSMIFVTSLLAITWTERIFFRTASVMYVVVATIAMYTTLTPIAAYLNPDSFGGHGVAMEMLLLGIHELEYYFIVSIWVIAFILADANHDMPVYAKVVGVLSVLNIISMIIATMLDGHGDMYQLNILAMFILYPIFVTGVVVLMRRLHQKSLSR